MDGTADQSKLSQDQKARIAETLKRIRGGLAHASPAPAPEPAHIFIPSRQEAK
jgi:hypothetical protein